MQVSKGRAQEAPRQGAARAQAGKSARARSSAATGGKGTGKGALTGAAPQQVSKGTRA